MPVKKIAHPSLEERRARGKEARTKASLSAHTGWKAAADRPDPVKLLQAHIAEVGVNLRDIRHVRRVAKRAPAVQVRVEPDDVMARRLKNGHHDGANVAEVAGDENAH